MHSGRPACPGTVCPSNMQGQNGRSSRTIIFMTKRNVLAQKKIVKTAYIPKRGRVGRIFCASILNGLFSVLPHMIERKKKSNLSVLDFKTGKNASSCSLFQVNTSPKGFPKARCFYATLCEGNIPSSPSRSFTGSSLSIGGTRYRAFFLPMAHTNCGRVGRSIKNRGPEFKRNYGLSPRCHGRALPV